MAARCRCRASRSAALPAAPPSARHQTHGPACQVGGWRWTSTAEALRILRELSSAQVGGCCTFGRAARAHGSPVMGRMRRPSCPARRPGSPAPGAAAAPACGRLAAAAGRARNHALIPLGRRFQLTVHPTLSKCRRSRWPCSSQPASRARWPSCATTATPRCAPPRSTSPPCASHAGLRSPLLPGYRLGCPLGPRARMRAGRMQSGAGSGCCASTSLSPSRSCAPSWRTCAVAALEQAELGLGKRRR